MIPTYNNYNAAQTPETGRKSLPAGGYVAQIVSAVFTESREKHLPMLEIRLEIAEGEYKGIFHAKVQQTGTWPNAGTRRLVLPEDPNVAADDWRLRNYKAMITAVEESNNRFRWTNDERTLRGCFVGVLYRDEEFIGQQDGQKHVSAKPAFFCSAQRIRSGEFTIPRPKLIQENAIQRPQTYTSVPQDAEFTPVDTGLNGDKDLPF